MVHNFECYPVFDFKTTERVFRRTPLRKNRIKFNFCFEFKTFKWFLDLDPMSPDSTIVYVSAHVSTAETSFSYEEIRERLKRVLTSDLPYLSDYGIEKLIDLAWEEACKAVRTKPLCGSYKVMIIDFKLLVQNHHFYHNSLHETSHEFCMVPAADSSIQSLKKCEISCTESCCCICLEDFSGEGCIEALSMPCEHVFHGDCIKEWLRTSHYCSLCRFEMPTS